MPVECAQSHSQLNGSVASLPDSMITTTCRLQSEQHAPHRAPVLQGSFVLDLMFASGGVIPTPTTSDWHGALVRSVK